MSSTVSDAFSQQPDWLWSLLDLAPELGRSEALGRAGLSLVDGLIRSDSLRSAAQEQTEQTFGFKWAKRDTYESEAMRSQMREWLLQKYGSPIELPIWNAAEPIVLDAGCGAAYSALEFFAPVFDRIRYLGVDISEAVDVARQRFMDRKLDRAAFIQADLVNLPVRDESVDIIFSEGVLHHTDSTKGAILALAKKLKPDGAFLFYVYRRKGPIREFTDDYIREKLQDMSPQEAWDAVMPLSQLGQVLGDLNVEVEVPATIDLLEIPAGKINLQRLFYWHVFKAFYRPEMTMDEMNHLNFDWYAPKNAHRQSIEEVRAWCVEAELQVLHETVEDAGITIVAKKGPH